MRESKKWKPRKGKRRKRKQQKYKDIRAHNVFQAHKKEHRELQAPQWARNIPDICPMYEEGWCQGMAELWGEQQGLCLLILQWGKGKHRSESAWGRCLWSFVSGCHVNRMQKPGKREESKIGQVVWEKQGINCSSRNCKEQWAHEKRGKYYFCPC